MFYKKASYQNSSSSKSNWNVKLYWTIKSVKETLVFTKTPAYIGTMRIVTKLPANEKNSMLQKKEEAERKRTEKHMQRYKAQSKIEGRWCKTKIYKRRQKIEQNRSRANRRTEMKGPRNRDGERQTVSQTNWQFQT